MTQSASPAVDQVAAPTSFDAATLLGFEPIKPLASVGSNEIVVRYTGWSLQELRDRRPDLMHEQDWYNKYDWSTEKLPSGLYVLRLPIVGSNSKTFAEQQGLLLSGEETAPVVIAATALLSLRVCGQPDPLKDGWTRCKEQTAGGYRVALRWHDGRLYVYNGVDDDPDDGVWMASARKTS